MAHEKDKRDKITELVNMISNLEELLETDQSIFFENDSEQELHSLLNKRNEFISLKNSNIRYQMEQYSFNA